ncbi:hypothetical protein [Chryseobacterium sp.]|uniref:hypothetical protein n=1 Tax=Chryseobacterium sp. TaxID=1871047 RepID=UPI00289EA655|nr:hypothetical protein [Chryseobacterium sp.]
MSSKNKPFLETKILSYSTLSIIVLVILCVWFSGINSHRSLFQNSLISTSILAGAFFLFISSGLYFGLKLKENIGVLVNKEKLKNISERVPLFELGSAELPAVGDGIGGIILSIILCFVVAILAAFLIYALGVFIWASIIIFTAILYWIFFRALRLVFKNSKYCRGNLFKSIAFGSFYSFLYISWMYIIIFLLHFLQHSEKVIAF